MKEKIKYPRGLPRGLGCKVFSTATRGRTAASGLFLTVASGGPPQERGQKKFWGYIRVILGLYWGNGKENGN